MTRPLVITEFPPMVKGFAERGNFRRFSLFMGAIRELTKEVDILHLWPSDDKDIARLNAEQSERFGLAVTTHVIHQKSRPYTAMDNYVLGIFSASRQTQYFPHCGPAQVEKVKQLLDRSPDFVFVQRLSGMLPVIRSGRRPKRMFFDLDDLEHWKRIQTAFEQRTWLRTLAHLAGAPTVLAAERRAAALSRLTFICSEVDRARLARLGLPRVTVVQNAVPMPRVIAPLPAAPRMLFLGFNYYKANADAAERLVRNVLPRIRAVVPDAEVVVAGKGTEQLSFYRDKPDGVRCLGYVEDLPALYASTRLVCCPVSYGTGTRMKLIEAGAHGRPIVATKLAAEGLAFRDDHEIILREDDDAIAAACVRLLTDDAFATRLGASARRLTELEYSEEIVRKIIVQKLSDAA